jgi:ribosomal-protein-alanine N-acetyltransferase
LAPPADHESAVLAFFQRFTEEHRQQLAEQETGICFYQVLVDDDGQVVGRFNLYNLTDRTAEVGYRVAERVAGRGVATSALHELCRIAPNQHQLSKLTAATNTSNVASQKVLVKAGFAMVGPTQVGGSPGLSYSLAL